MIAFLGVEMVRLNVLKGFHEYGMNDLSPQVSPLTLNLPSPSPSWMARALHHHHQHLSPLAAVSSLHSPLSPFRRHDSFRMVTTKNLIILGGSGLLWLLLISSSPCMICFDVWIV